MNADYREPMIGWAYGVEVCSHNLPVDVCDGCFDAALDAAQPATLNVGPRTIEVFPLGADHEADA